MMENAGQYWIMRDQYAGLEIVGLENGGNYTVWNTMYYLCLLSPACRMRPLSMIKRAAVAPVPA